MHQSESVTKLWSDTSVVGDISGRPKRTGKYGKLAIIVVSLRNRPIVYKIPYHHMIKSLSELRDNIVYYRIAAICTLRSHNCSPITLHKEYFQVFRDFCAQGHAVYHLRRQLGSMPRPSRSVEFYLGGLQDNAFRHRERLWTQSLHVINFRWYSILASPKTRTEICWLALR